MAVDRDKELEIIALRAGGASYANIGLQVGVSKQTAVNICRRNREKLATLEALAIDELHEAQRVSYEERIKALATLMNRVRDEIDKRDLTSVSTEKLLEIYLRQSLALKDELIEPNIRSSNEQEQAKQEREFLDRLSREAT